VDTPPANGKGDGLLLILLLTVFFAATAADPAVAQVQLPSVNLGDTNFEDGFEAPGWFLEEFPGGYTAGELKDSKLRFPRCRNPRNDGPPAGCAGRHAGYLADGCVRVAA
jgi:hypothetical protein